VVKADAISIRTIEKWRIFDFIALSPIRAGGTPFKVGYTTYMAMELLFVPVNKEKGRRSSSGL